MSRENEELIPRWYVVHTYSGYENKVKKDLENKVKNRELAACPSWTRREIPW